MKCCKMKFTRYSKRHFKFKQERFKMPSTMKCKASSIDSLPHIPDF